MIVGENEKDVGTICGKCRGAQETGEEGQAEMHVSQGWKVEATMRGLPVKTGPTLVPILTNTASMALRIAPWIGSRVVATDIGMPEIICADDDNVRAGSRNRGRRRRT